MSSAQALKLSGVNIVYCDYCEGIQMDPLLFEYIKTTVCTLNKNDSREAKHQVFIIY
jgi:hypothetical protein